MDKKDTSNEILSFDELKNKVQASDKFSVKEDPNVQDLLSSLGDEDVNGNDQGFSLNSDEITDISDFEDIDSDKEELDVKDLQTKTLYDEIVSAVEKTEVTPDSTSRRNKYSSEEKSYIDVTNIYQKPRAETVEPIESAIVRPDKKRKEPEALEAPADLEQGDISVDEIKEPTQNAEISIENNTVGKKKKKHRNKKEKANKKKNLDDDDENVKTFNEVFKDFFRGFFPNKHDKTSEIIRKIIMDISVFTLIGCGIWFGVLMGQKNAANNQIKKLKGQVIQDNSSQSEQDAWQEFFAKYPNVSLPEGMKAKYAYLYAINNALVGWVRIPNTAVDVQVVQAPDNEEYLKKDFYGNYSRYGCPFMDYRNDPKYLSQNTIVYGHHMSDGLVFAELDKYKKVDGFQESPIIEFDTLYKTYKYKVYAAFIAGSSPSQDNGYLFNYISPNFASRENFESYIKALDERTLYSTGVSIDYTDKIITLSTCSYEFSDARFVVVGRLLRDGESETVDTTLAKINENPRYPQIWYDKKGQTNPFALAEKWYPEIVIDN